jgi:hypothetical protein
MWWGRLCSVIAGLMVTAAGSAEAEGPDFNREVRPILSRFCFKCHGPDETTRESGVRLDLRDAAVGPGESGETIIVPGRPAESELHRRITATDPDLVMPPPATHLELTAAQQQTIADWIAAGAEFAPHWAFVAPQGDQLPTVQAADWPRNGIDHFVLAGLEARGVAPSPEAERVTLARRAALDLLGLPPSAELVEAFLHDPSEDAYERYVDGLLSSPQYGERWARKWLDLARYADTNGYEKDRPRTVWPYRDWVIAALNADQPFDQFTIEQLAGDLLPTPTESQRIATGFHRNTMLNEEGGIDPLEFRFHALTDRVATTGAVWLGMTIGCAQCHTHKYDPVTHTEYYQLLAFLNNADEPELEVPTATVLAQRAALTKTIEEREAKLPEHFPPYDNWTWQTATVIEAQSQGDATLTIGEDQSVLVTGNMPEVDQYTLVVETDLTEIAGIQLEALTDPSLGQQGPGRTPHGNFVLTHLQVDQKLDGEQSMPQMFQAAMADFAQEQFPAEHAIDESESTGWAIHGVGKWNVPRTLTARFTKRVRPEQKTQWVIRLEQKFGKQHTLGKFRIRFGSITDTRTAKARRQARFDDQFAAWTTQLASRSQTWNVATPVEWQTTLPRLTRLDDQSLLASGDLSKRDVYDVVFGSELNGATAVRLEVLPHPSLPKRGPGAVYYEGPFGDFYLSEIQWKSGAEPDWTGARWNGAANSFANGHNTAAAAIDGNPLTGWSIDGGQGQSHVAVFRFAQPLDAADSHHLRMIFERFYAAGVGRFRVAYTRDATVSTDAALMPELNELAKLVPQQRTAEQTDQLIRQFCREAPELATERNAIEALRKQLPSVSSALVMRERPADHPRETHRHHRGEYLQPKEVVTAALPGFLPPLPAGSTANRLTFAQWLVSPENPLVGRVTVNRHWGVFFGRGLVRTTEDFGYQGEQPTHPELLDWLAVEFIRQGWSMKQLHRLIVTSATYRQSSAVTPELLANDPQNLWLARGPRVRLEAEMIRDVVLATAGLLSDKANGPSVYPPQPESITTEGTYGRLNWVVSTGEDRYRRGLYTFAKRTAPYAMMTTFDGPSGEACLPRREASNTPLQALTLLNDEVFLEAAQQLGQDLAAYPGSLDDKARLLFERILVRSPTVDEQQLVVTFYQRQHTRFTSGGLPVAEVAGNTSQPTIDQAAWTATARVLLNLDETIVKE